MPPEREPFLPYRGRIVQALAIVTALGVAPFVINNFLQGRVVLGAAGAVFIAILTVDALAIHRGREMPIALWTLALPVAVTMVAAVVTEHYLALAWCYPIVVFFYFILRRNAANAVAALLVVSLTPLLWATLGMSLATRFAATMILTAVLINIFVTIIADLYRRLAEQAITDPLTQAFNRRHMDWMLSEQVGRMARGDLPPSIVIIDIDHFKAVNDRHGHAVGDTVLSAVADTVRSRVRKIDHLFRSGGEEFVLLLPDTNLAGATLAADGIRRAIADQRILPDRAITVSAGVSELQGGESAEAWLKRADDALYEAKSLGRDRVIARAAAPDAVAAD